MTPDPDCGASNSYWNGSACVSQCPDGLFGNNQNRMCVTPENCPQDHFGNPTQGKCTTANLCGIGDLYANPETKMCGPAADCPDGHYGFPNTRMCVANCYPLIREGNVCVEPPSGCSGSVLCSGETESECCASRQACSWNGHECPW